MNETVRLLSPEEVNLRLDAALVKVETRLQAAAAEAAELLILASKAVLTTSEAVRLGYLPNRAEACRMRENATGPVWHQMGAKTIRYRRADLEAWLNGPGRRQRTIDEVRVTDRMAQEHTA